MFQVLGSTMDTSGQFKELIDTLEDLTETVKHVGIIACDFEEQSQDVLNTKINDMVKGLKKLNDLKDNFGQVQVPYEVLSYIDQGRNPQLYTKDCLEKAKLKNEETKEKINSLQSFKDSLVKELKTNMPATMEQYEQSQNSR